MQLHADIDFFRQRPIDKSVPIPFYFQLMEIFQDYIATYEHGTPIPTEAELCSVYDISRPTVRQAMAELSAEGRIERKKGKGSFVNKRMIQQDFLLNIMSFNDEMQAKGLVPETEVLTLCTRKAPPQVSKKLGLRTDEEVAFMSRLRSIDHEPVVLVNTYLPEALVRGLTDHDMAKNSLYHLLESEYHLRIARTVRVLELRAAGKYEAAPLGIAEGAPLHYIETVAFMDDGRPIEFSAAYYRGDRNKFTIEVRDRSSETATAGDSVVSIATP